MNIGRSRAGSASHCVEISRRIEAFVPTAIGKIGGKEGSAVSDWLNPLVRILRRDRLGRRMHALYYHSGVFPEELKTLRRFAEIMIADVLPQSDFLVKWRGGDDEKLHRALRLKAVWLESADLGTPAAWWQSLSEKRVLVVSPFVHTLRRQIARLHEVWPDGELPLSPDRVSVLACPHYAHLVPPRDADWFSGLERLKSEMNASEYDVALIGAGAWSLPLAVHAKTTGKIGVHLGGSTQLMFGITGERWRRLGFVPEKAAQAWIAPLPEDTPSTINAASSGFRKDCAYW